MGQVLVSAGHGELDLVADALLWAFGRARSRHAEGEAEQQNPEGVWAGLRVHLRGTGTSAHFTHTGLCSFSLSCKIFTAFSETSVL